MIKFVVSVNNENGLAADANNLKEKFHNALVGSPAYVNSEIAICNGRYDNEFVLIIGNECKKDDDNLTIRFDGLVCTQQE